MQANDYERANLIDTLTCALNSKTLSMLNRSSTYEKGQEFLIKVSTNKSSIKEEDPEEKQDQIKEKMASIEKQMKIIAEHFANANQQGQQ